MDANQWLLKVFSPLGIKSVMVFIMKSSNLHMAVAVSHAVCVRRALSCMNRKTTKKAPLDKYNKELLFHYSNAEGLTDLII